MDGFSQMRIWDRAEGNLTPSLTSTFDPNGKLLDVRSTREHLKKAIEEYAIDGVVLTVAEYNTATPDAPGKDISFNAIPNTKEFSSELARFLRFAYGYIVTIDYLAPMNFTESKEAPHA